MLLMSVDAARGVIEPVGSAFQDDPLKNMPKRFFQRLVASQLSDLKVNVLIVHKTFSSEPILHVAAVQIHLLAQLIKPSIGKLFNRLLHRKCFERFTEIVEL